MAADRNRFGWQRLADVEIPRGTLLVAMLASLVRMRREDHAWEELGKISEELGSLIGTRWREGDERERQLVTLQASIERLTRRLLFLTVALGLIGLASIVATLCAALGA